MIKEYFMQSTIIKGYNVKLMRKGRTMSSPVIMYVDGNNWGSYSSKTNAIATFKHTIKSNDLFNIMNNGVLNN